MSNSLFFDLCLNFPDTSNVPDFKTFELLAYSQIDGYKVCALNSKIDNIQLFEKKVFKAKTEDLKEKIYQIKQNILLNSIKTEKTHDKSNNQLLTDSEEYPILTKVTFEIKEKKDFHSLESILNLSYIDILAVNIKNDSLLEYACNEANVDLITISNLERINFYSKKKQILHAIDRGIYFEFLLSELINNESNRPIFIYNFTILCEITRGRNIVLSSGADSFISQRSPYDVLVMLETLFNINNKLAKSFIVDNPQKVVKQGFERKFYKKTILIQGDDYKTGIKLDNK